MTHLEKDTELMSKLRVRLVLGIILLAAVSAAFYGVLYHVNLSVRLSQNIIQGKNRIYDAGQEIMLLQSYQADAAASELETRLKVMGLNLKPLLGTDDGAGKAPVTGPSYVDEGKAFVRVTEEKVEAPEEMPSDVKLDPELFMEEKGFFFSGSGEQAEHIIYYYKVADSFYYIEWDAYEKSTFYRAGQELEEGIRAMEDAFALNILWFSRMDDENGKPTYIVTYVPESFPKIETPEEYGFTDDLLAGAEQMEENRNKDIEKGTADYQPVVIDGKEYECFIRTPDQGLNVLAFMIPASDVRGGAVRKTAYQTILFLIIAAAFFAWAYSVRILVIKHNLNEEQRKTFSPRAVCRKAVVFVVVGALMTVGFSAFLESLFASYNMTKVADRCLESLTDRLKSEEEKALKYEKMRMESFEQCAQSIARKLAMDLEAEETEEVLVSTLESSCREINADYIVIFDESGKQVLTNSDYSGLTLSGSGEGIRDFRRLLNGVPLISKTRVEDEVTGQSKAVIGTCVPVNANDGGRRYWAMLLYVNPEQVQSNFMQPVEEVMGSIVYRDTMCFSADPDSGKILSASKPELKGRNALVLGLPEDALVDSYMGFFSFNGISVYAKCVETNGVLYYYTIGVDRMYQAIPTVMASTVCTYLILMAIMAFILISGYRKLYQAYALIGEELREDKHMILTPSGKIKRSIDPSSRWTFSASQFGSSTPFHNAYTAATMIYVSAVIVIAAFVLTGQLSVENSAVAFIVKGGWTRGLNLFAVANILFLFVEVSISVIFIKALLRAITMYNGTKSETIGRFLLNFVNYAAVIVFIYFALSYIGIKTETLLASLGLLTFALSLGAQDLVKDILAGLAIVFDGAYQVGDIIEINGFRGTVLEVGVRSIKIEGRGGNILIVGNRDVKNIINKTRKNSWYALEIKIKEGQDICAVEKLLMENLPAIGESIEGIISGPVYKGITGIERGAIILSIIAECEEKDYHAVGRELNRAVIVLFEIHGIAIA